MEADGDRNGGLKGENGENLIALMKEECQMIMKRIKRFLGVWGSNE